MSYLLTRIPRVLAEPPEEEATNAVLTAIMAHWKSLYTGDPVKFAPLKPHIESIQTAAFNSEEAQQHYVTAALAEWEGRRELFQLDATLGGPPGEPTEFGSMDWGTHWILFQWKPPATGGAVWGYRIERTADFREYAVMDVCIEPEVTLLHQPQGQKFFYRVIPFNGWGDGTPGNVFGITFDADLVDWRDEHEIPGENEDEADDAQK